MPMKSFNAQQGFTLLEALIAMFLTAGAILGLGILHIKSVQQSQLAMQRTVANIQANDFIDSMWANRCSLSSKVEKDWTDRWDFTKNGMAGTGQIALNQLLQDWKGEITPDPAANQQQYEIVISWTNKKAAWYRADGDTEATRQSFTYNFTLPACTT